MVKQLLLCTATAATLLSGSAVAQRADLALVEPRAEAQVAPQPVTGIDDEMLTSVSRWISVILNLAEPQVVPRVRYLPVHRVAASRLTDSVGQSVQGQRQVVLSDWMNMSRTMDFDRNRTDSVAQYNDATRTVYLPTGWTGATAQEMSILVHALVYHFQNAHGLRYHCAEERRELAYDAQRRWLALYDVSLEAEFGLNPALLMMITQCIP